MKGHWTEKWDDIKYLTEQCALEDKDEIPEITAPVNPMKRKKLQQKLGWKTHLGKAHWDRVKLLW